MTGDGSADGDAQAFVDGGIGVGGRDEEVGGDGEREEGGDAVVDVGRLATGVSREGGGG